MGLTAAAAAKPLPLCPTLSDPIDGSPPGSPSLGFSRQEHWSGLPFPSPMHESEKWKWSRSVVSDSSQPHGLQPTRLLHPWDFPGKSTGVECHCLLHRSYWIESKELAIFFWKLPRVGVRVGGDGGDWGLRWEGMFSCSFGLLKEFSSLKLNDWDSHFLQLWAECCFGLLETSSLVLLIACCISEPGMEHCILLMMPSFWPFFCHCLSLCPQLGEIFLFQEFLWLDWAHPDSPE